MNAVLRVPPPFFPYGAPELKASARRHLSRALGVGSLLWVVAFVALGVALSLVRIEPVRIPLEPDHHLVPPPLFPHVVPEPPGSGGPPRTDPHATPHPVPFAPSTIPETAPTLEGPTEGPGTETIVPGTPPAIAPPVEEVPADPLKQRAVDELPAVVKMVKPTYPELARIAGVEGVVIAWALVGLDGNVREVRIQKGIDVLNASAIDALRQWHFTPAWRDGHPVPAWVAVPVRYTLHGTPE